MADTRNTLTFHGKGSALLGRYLVNVLLSIVTLGIYSFWGKAKILGYLYEETQLNGSPLEFRGTGKQLFLGYLKFVGLTAVLVGIPTIIFTVVIMGAAMNGEVGGILVPLFVFYAYLLGLFAVLIPMAANGWFRFRMRVSAWRGLTGRYTGLNKELIPMYLVGLLLTILTLGIYGSWLRVKIDRYVWSHLSFGGVKAEFTGKGSELFWINLKGIVLSIITLGIYGFWYARNLYRWNARSIVLVQNGQKHALSTPLTAGDLFKFWVPNLLLLVVTLGLAFPWFQVNSLRFFVRNVTLPDGIDIDLAAQEATTEGTAAAEAFHDFLDLGDFGLL